MTTTPSKAKRPHMPSDVTPDLSLFDRFATGAAHFASRAWFFAFCVALVVLWAPTYFLVGTVDTWQLIINTITTIVTFLLVALLQNTETRTDAATQDKLNALAQGLSELMTHIADIHDREDLRDEVEELRMSVGLEDTESAD
ncbi:low affinity iron permease family protein [Catenulispora subtropica]|uniref:Low affinity iron permease family protein n=1 Tax=Catenulispora subtropica TaxID=450798 RepID=A0ABN2T8R7_9ACTN